jgi:hypothetical protein
MKDVASTYSSSDFQQTTRRYISEDWNLHNHRCENLKFYMSEGNSQIVEVKYLLYL